MKPTHIPQLAVTRRFCSSSATTTTTAPISTSFSAAASSSLSPFRGNLVYNGYSRFYAMTKSQRKEELLQRSSSNSIDDDDEAGSAVQSQQPRFPRRQNDPELFHGVSPENLRFVNNDTDYGETELGGVSVAAASSADPDAPQMNEPEFRHSYSDSAIPAQRSTSFLGHEGEQVRLARKQMRRDAIPSAEFPESRPPLPKKAARALATERRLLQVLDSTVDDEMKSTTALEITSTIQKENLPLRARLAEEVLSLWNRMCTDDLVTSSSSSLSPPRALQLIEPMSQLYFHLRRHHTAPTPMAMEHVMSVVHLCAAHEVRQQQEATNDDQGADEESAANIAANSNNNKNRHNLKALSPALHKLWNLANRVMIDSDRFTVLPTRITFSSYFDICGLTGHMDIALVRFADAKNSLFLEPDSAMVRSIIGGLCRNGLIDEALAFIARVSAVNVDLSMLNTTLELLVLSDEPMAAFAAFRSLEQSGIVPDTTTFFHLLRACEASGQHDVGVPFVLAQMQRLKVKGDDLTLNLLLKGLLLAHGMSGYATQLYIAMKQKGIGVFEQVEASLPERVQLRGSLLEQALERKKQDREGGKFDTPEHLLEATRAEQQQQQDQQIGITNKNDSKNKAATAARDIARDNYLRYLAAHNRLNNKSAAPTRMLCGFALRHKLGTFEQQDEMRQFMRLMKQRMKQRSSHGSKQHEHEDQQQQQQQQQQQISSVSRSLRPVLLRLIHKHFYGVLPASTRVIDGRTGAGARGAGGLRTQRL